MFHEDQIFVEVKPDNRLHGGRSFVEHPLPVPTSDGRHMKCLLQLGSKPQTAMVCLEVRDSFKLYDASILRVSVEAKGMNNAPDIINSYLCRTSARMHALVVRTVDEKLLEFGRASPEDGNDIGRRKICIIVTRGKLQSLSGPKEYSS
ncbi:unnamed protein product [Zymoseptoria tritici ST99CH_3D1]|nr:unnamed protein product [Zymoseptoria tritici ST99CH_3D1]